MLKKPIRFLVLLALVSCKGQPEAPTLPPANRNTLRILDINVWSGLDYLGYVRMGEYETKEVRDRRYRILVNQIKELDPDVIGVHEANKLPDYAERLARDLGAYDAFYHVGVGGVRLGKVGLPWNLREGDVILTKKDLHGKLAGRRQLSGGHVGNFFTFHFSDATQIIAVEITNKGRPFYVFATHWHASILETDRITQTLDSFQSSAKISEAELAEIRSKITSGVDWRVSESEKTVVFIREIASEHPFVLMGDFNATSDSKEIANLLQFGMVDAFRTCNPITSGFTWDPTTNLNHKKHYDRPKLPQSALSAQQQIEAVHRSTPKRIDFVFVGPPHYFESQKIAVKSSRVVLDRADDGMHASDHYGVYAEIVFPD